MSDWLAALILVVSTAILLIAILPRRRRNALDQPQALVPTVAAVEPPRAELPAPAPAVSAALFADIEEALVRARQATTHVATLEAEIIQLHEQFQQRLDEIEATLQVRLNALEQGFKADLMARVEEQRVELERISDHFQWLRMIASGLHKQESREPQVGVNGAAVLP
jgi:hypothetical protein